MTLDYIELFYPQPSPRTDHTFADLVQSLGPDGSLATAALSAMGIAAPEPGDLVRIADEAVLRAFLEAWGPAGHEAVLRAARIFGDAVGHAAEGWVRLFDEVIGSTGDGSLETVDDIVPRIVPPAARIARVAPQLLAWLLQRHMERVMNDVNITSIEQQLERRGMVPRRLDSPPAVVFVDLSGYTRLTEERGDELAARTAIRLAELAAAIVRRHDGRLVKLLGDGVMAAFEHPSGGTLAALDLVAAVEAAGLPAAHAGVNAGPRIIRDGDYFGHTVNVAARVAGAAESGEVLVTQAVADAAAGAQDLAFTPAGSVALKGVAEPAALYRAVRR